MLKPIKLTATDAINEAINAAEGRATVRTLDASHLTVAAEQAEKRLQDAGVPKKLWQGVTVSVNPHSVPNSYNKGMGASSTQATLIRRSADWALVNVVRGRCHTASYGVDRELATCVALHLPAAEITPLVSSMLTAHGITPVAAKASVDAAQVA